MLELPVEISEVGEIFKLVPVWFYLFSAIAYGISALISLFIAYFSFKSYKSTDKKFYLLLFASFMILTASYCILTFTSIYTYFYQDFFRGFLGLNFVNYNGINLYYAATLIAYALLDVLYIPKKAKNRLHVFLVPLWYLNLSSFHILSVILLSFVVFKNALNFVKIKTLNSFLVLLCFSMIILFHLSMLLLPFDMTYYLLAHVLLAAGFASLLVMLIRVNYNAKKKK